MRNASLEDRRSRYAGNKFHWVRSYRKPDCCVRNSVAVTELREIRSGPAPPLAFENGCNKRNPDCPSHSPQISSLTTAEYYLLQHCPILPSPPQSKAVPTPPQQIRASSPPHPPHRSPQSQAPQVARELRPLDSPAEDSLRALSSPNLQNFLQLAHSTH